LPEEKINIVIIPARGGSKAIPGKNIVDFCGKPLIGWTIQQALHAQSVHEVYVSTDNKTIRSVSKEFGAHIIHRPHELATDTSTSEQALLHALDVIQKDFGYIDSIVFLQATSPLRTSDDIDESIRLFQKEKADCILSASILEDACIWKFGKIGLESVTFDHKNRLMRQERKPYYLENGSIYIIKPEILKALKNRTGGKISVYTMPGWKSFEIDTYSDLEICEYFMKTKIIPDGDRSER